MRSLDVIKHSELRFERRHPDAHICSSLSSTGQNIKSRYVSIKFKLIAIVRLSGVTTKHVSRRAKHLFTCGEKCQFAPHIGAVVISLSACRDHQITWEDKLSQGAAMTVVLVGILEKDPAITLRHLMKKLSHGLWIDALRRHAEFRKWFERKGFKRFSAEELQKFKDDPLFGFDPQVPQASLPLCAHVLSDIYIVVVPQLGGMRRLPMTETLMPVRRLLVPRRGHTMPISINLPSMNSPQV
ncbi:hypothetical protein EWM64_g6799 [Hericium alpestre]|uniref:Uncharacterized protein n=1 Tax=Hericium alpestre TaxID=135208 RepID=A0A4Y9ZSH1_9AGAM|nr:hypothetical protein EWM64_g6799 [Hericium alpestre]